MTLGPRCFPSHSERLDRERPGEIDEVRLDSSHKLQMTTDEVSGSMLKDDLSAVGKWCQKGNMAKMAKRQVGADPLGMCLLAA